MRPRFEERSDGLRIPYIKILKPRGRRAVASLFKISNPAEGGRFAPNSVERRFTLLSAGAKNKPRGQSLGCGDLNSHMCNA